MYSSVSFLIFTTLMDVGGVVGGAFVGGGALVGGGAFVGGGSNFSFGSGGMKLFAARGGAAGGGLHSGSGRFAQGFSSESLGENVELLSNSVLMRNRALLDGLIDSAVLTLSMFGTGGGGGRA